MQDKKLQSKLILATQEGCTPTSCSHKAAVQIHAGCKQQMLEYSTYSQKAAIQVHAHRRQQSKFMLTEGCNPTQSKFIITKRCNPSVCWQLKKAAIQVLAHRRLQSNSMQAESNNCWSTHHAHIRLQSNFVLHARRGLQSKFMLASQEDRTCNLRSAK